MENIKTFEVDGNRLIADFEINKYYIVFKNYEGKEIKSEIPKDIFNTYIESKKTYKRNENEEARHWEHIILSENEMYKRAFKHSDSIETIVIKHEINNNLHIAISKLTNVQAKRIKQYYFEEKTEREIAKEEGLKHQSIHDSLEYGKEKIKKFLKKFEK